MAFEKGTSGNPNGKPKGAKNKVSLQLRETITDFLESNFEKVVRDFDKMQPKNRAKLYCDLLQYGLPKLQSVSVGLDFEKMTDEQLNRIIDELKRYAEADGQEE